MKRGVTEKHETENGLALERRMITRVHQLDLDRKRCVGCEMCSMVCPQEAITLTPAVVENGHIVTRPSIDIDPAKCNFCGECVVVCHAHALALRINGEARIPVLEYEAFPVLTREITINPAGLPIELVDQVEAVCPTHVIDVSVERDEAGNAVAVKDIVVDLSNCIYCKQCEAVAPKAFRVQHPFEGVIRLDATKCPEGCEACAEICPTHTLTVQDGEVTLDDRFCIYCKACIHVCPVPEALHVERYRVKHTPIKSGAWVNAVEELISAEHASDELDAKSQSKRRRAIAFLLGAPKPQQ